MTDKKGAKHRLLIAKGQIEKVIRMTEDGAYCIDVIHQIQAVRSALKQTELLILDQHLNSCVVEQIRQGKDKEVVEEIMKVVEKHG